MDEEQLKKLGVTEEQLENRVKELLDAGLLDELEVFFIGRYLKEVIETAVANPDSIDELPPIVEFEMPKKGVKVVVSIEKLEGDGRSATQEKTAD